MKGADGQMETTITIWS